MHSQITSRLLRVLVLVSILIGLGRANSTPQAAAQEESIDLLAPRLLKDINAVTYTSDPEGLFSYNGLVYFTANDGAHGREVWSTDGTPESLRLLKDINPARENGARGDFGNLGDTLFFPAKDGSGNGIELWKSNGTEIGTVMVKDIYNSGDSVPDGFVTAGDLLFFTAEDGTGRKLWRTDGTESGTLRVADILVFAYDDNSTMAAFNGLLYFQGCITTDHCELWRTDGTPGQAVQVTNINPTGSAYPDYLNVTGDTLYFLANDGQHGRELWKTTSSGAEIVADINPGSGDSYPQFMTLYQGEIYFVATTATHGRELWRIDASNGGAVIAKDFNPGTGNGVWMWYQPMIEMGGALYLIADDGTHGRELWKMAGTTFSMVADINPGNNGSNIGRMTILNGVLYFSAQSLPAENDSFSNYKLWRSDGTPNGTYMFKDITPGSGNNFHEYPMISHNGMLFFSAIDRPYQSELWISDGTAYGTMMIPLNKETASSAIDVVVPFGNNLFFTADDGIHGNEPWITNGNLGGTRLIKDIIPGKIGGAYPYGTLPVSMGGKLFFSGYALSDRGDYWPALWVTDGTEAGTHLIWRSYPSVMVSVDNTVFFICGGNPGISLYKTDGTSQGTVEVKTWGEEYRLKWSGTSLDGRFYFDIYKEAENIEHWESDGTPAGTHSAIITPRVDAFLNKRGIELPNGLVLYFDGGKVWQTDGTPGSEQVIEGDYQVSLEWGLVSDGWLYFGATPANSDWTDNLFRTKGTNTGVELVTERIHSIQRVAGERVYFTYGYKSGDIYEKHIGRSGGEPAVTERLEPVSGTYHFEPTSGWCNHIAELFGQSYFYGTDAEHGAELWTSDGTSEGTRVIDIFPGPNPSGADNLFALNGRLLFTADDGTHGKEWWFIDPRDQWIYLPLVGR